MDLADQPLADDIRACTLCVDREGCGALGTRPVPGLGPKDAKVVAVARNPGFDEDSSGKPLQGPSGKLFDRMMHFWGFPRETIGTVNVMGCFTKQPTNRPPTELEIENCSPWFERQLSWFENKKVVIAMGREAIKATVGHCASKLDEIVGQTFAAAPRPGRKLGWVVIPTWHPSYLIRCETGSPLDQRRLAKYREYEAPQIKERLAQLTADRDSAENSKRPRQLGLFGDDESAW